MGTKGETFTNNHLPTFNHWSSSRIGYFYFGYFLGSAVSDSGHLRIVIMRHLDCYPDFGSHLGLAHGLYPDLVPIYFNHYVRYPLGPGCLKYCRSSPVGGPLASQNRSILA